MILVSIVLLALAVLFGFAAWVAWVVAKDSQSEKQGSAGFIASAVCLLFSFASGHVLYLAIRFAIYKGA